VNTKEEEAVRNTTFMIALFSMSTFGCADEQSMSEYAADGSRDGGEFIEAMPVDESEVNDGDPLDSDQALEIALELGVNSLDLVYADQLPFVLTENAAKMTHGFIENIDGDFVVTYLDLWTGDVISLQEPAGDNILDFIEQSGLKVDLSMPQPPGSSLNSYNTFPGRWRLPMEYVSRRSYGFDMTQGYGGSLSHYTNHDYYATDWVPEDNTGGELLESPASCWVMYAGNAGDGYGNQVVGECGNAGSGRRYGYRVAHMNATPMVTAGWWIGKGRDLGYVGNTGFSTAPHVHFAVFRGNVSGAAYSVEGLPINRWPTSSKGICSGAMNSYSLWGFINSFDPNTHGCPR
jgi:murein DD-endopeptidase MepM/ murein hydrolase activator NlpD